MFTAQRSTTSTTTGFANITSATLTLDSTTASDNLPYILDCQNVGERSGRANLTKAGTNTSDESCIAILYNGPKKRPLTQSEAADGVLVYPGAG